MERELWKLLWQLLSVLCKCLPRGKFGDEEILAVYFWAVLNERPISWACDQTHWPLDLLPPSLPSQPATADALAGAASAGSFGGGTVVGADH